MNSDEQQESTSKSTSACSFCATVDRDLYRYRGKVGLLTFLNALITEVGFCALFLTRLAANLRTHWWSRYGLYHLAKFFHWRFTRRYGVFLDISTQIGPGLYLAHGCGIVINHRAVIGDNCNIGQHVTIGSKSRGERAGNPIIGDRVYIAPGAVIIGAIMVGDNAAIGANAVVTRDVPAGAVVVGVPAEKISDAGSAGYINDVYEDPDD